MQLQPIWAQSQSQTNHLAAANFYRLAYNRIVIFLENRSSLIRTFHTLCKSRSVSKWVSGSGGHAAVWFCLRICQICFTVSSLLLFQSRIRLIAKMQSCRLFGAKLKPLAGFATKNQLACMSAVPEPIRKPDVKFSKVNLWVFTSEQLSAVSMTYVAHIQHTNICVLGTVMRVSIDKMFCSQSYLLLHSSPKLDCC